VRATASLELSSQSLHSEMVFQFIRWLWKLSRLFAILAIAIAIPAVTVPIPVVPVFEAAAISFPIAVVEALTIVTRSYPSSTVVGWSSPIAAMPPVVSSHGIPVTINPHKFRSRLRGKNSHHVRPRWRTDADTDRYLSA
jgi:hypothetical protein